MKRRATILDIAKAARVTDGTVSRALRGSHLVKEATRDKVRKIAEELGYRSFVSGRGLVTGKTQTLGLITPSLRYPLNAEIAECLQEAVGDKGYGLLITSLDNHDELAVSRMRMLSEHCVDGIFLQPSMSRKDISCIEIIEHYRIPFVVTTEIFDHQVSFVSFDNFDAAQQITRHVLQQGYRRPALITGWASLSGVPGLTRGFQETLSEFGIDPDFCPIHHQEEFTTAAIGETIHGLLDHTPGLDCILSVDMTVTMHAYLILRERGIKIGPDFGLAGLDDAGWFQKESLSITSLKFPLDLIAEEMLAMLLERIDHPNVPLKKTYFIPTLEVRNSTIRNSS
jgi:DNA-binding LacI/PurR family transcriptional regulator